MREEHVEKIGLILASILGLIAIGHSPSIVPEIMALLPGRDYLKPFGWPIFLGLTLLMGFLAFAGTMIATLTTADWVGRVIERNRARLERNRAPLETEKTGKSLEAELGLKMGPASNAMLAKFIETSQSTGRRMGVDDSWDLLSEIIRDAIGRREFDSVIAAFKSHELKGWYVSGPARLLLAECLAARGTARAASGNCDGALTDLNEALTIDPRLALARSTRLELLEALGDFDAALADLLHLPTTTTSREQYVRLLRQRAATNERSGRIDAAIADWRELSSEAASREQFVRHVRLLRQRAATNERSGRINAAMSDDRTLPDGKAQIVRLLLLRAEASTKSGEIDAAVADCAEVLEIEPENETAFDQMSKLLQS